GAVWDYYCLSMGVLTDKEWIKEVLKYEKEVLSKR
ncbi:MAG: L-rhamnose isomerase, partial [Actinobacteria bacterium]|nr:L-rhamnose isomerase [Actinomycetota bacterium]